MVRGALLWLSTRMSLPLIRSANAEDTARYLILLARQYGTIDNNKTSLRSNRRTLTDKEQQVRTLASLDGIGRKSAIRILEHCGTLAGVVRASLEELSDIKGVGAAKAEKVKKMFVS